MKRNPGTGTISNNGYVCRTFGSIGSWKGKKYDGVRKLEHRHVIEQILGRSLKYPEEVHHWNENKTDNTPSNLVVCPDRAYHMLLHRRTRAYDACGHADWLRCPYCKQYDDPQNMVVIPRKGQTKGVPRTGMRWYHSVCSREAQNNRSAV